MYSGHLKRKHSRDSPKKEESLVILLVGPYWEIWGVIFTSVSCSLYTTPHPHFLSF